MQQEKAFDKARKTERKSQNRGEQMKNRDSIINIENSMIREKTCKKEEEG